MIKLYASLSISLLVKSELINDGEKCSRSLLTMLLTVLCPSSIKKLKIKTYSSVLHSALIPRSLLWGKGGMTYLARQQLWTRSIFFSIEPLVGFLGSTIPWIAASLSAVSCSSPFAISSPSPCLLLLKRHGSLPVSLLHLHLLGDLKHLHTTWVVHKCSSTPLTFHTRTKWHCIQTPFSEYIHIVMKTHHWLHDCNMHKMNWLPRQAATWSDYNIEQYIEFKLWVEALL